MGKRTTFPTSYAQNVRPIIRKQGRFDDGMRLDKDCSALDIGQYGDYPHALSYLNNCRGHRNHIIGDPGTVRFTAANAALTITDNTESAATAVTSGELYVANDDVAPAGGWIFEVLGTGDFTGNDLEAAKGDVVRPHDHFGIINDTPEFIYLGNCRIPAIPGYGDTSATEISATKAGTTITRVSGPEFTENLVGSYFVWGDGNRDPIEEFVDEDTIEVYNSETSKSGTMCKIEPEVYASHQHRALRDHIIMAGQKIYRAKSVPPTGWDEIVGCTDTELSAEMSTLVDDNKDMILLNPAGFFRIKLNGNRWYYKLNEEPPSDHVDDVNETQDTYEYQTRMMYTHCLIVGTDPLLTDRRGVPDASLDHETCTSQEFLSGEPEYGVQHQESQTSSEDTITWPALQAPTAEKCGLSHYSLYKTKSVHPNHVDAGNNKNIFVWVKDVPLAYGMRVNIDAAGLCDVVEGQIRLYETGQNLILSDGTESEITNIISTTQFEITPCGVYTGIAAGIGGSRTLRVIINDTAITVSEGTLTDDDENKLLFCSSKYVLIKSVTDSTHAVAAWSDTVDDGGAMLDPVSRTIIDTMDETELQTRIEAQDNEFLLKVRYYSPLPAGDIFAIANGWMVVSDDAKYYYGDLTIKQHAGYNHYKQYNDKLKDVITQFVAKPDDIIIRCRNSTHSLLTTVTSEGGDSSLGEVYQILKDPIQKDPNTGVLHQLDSVSLPGGRDLVVTNHLDVRIFNGETYGVPIDIGRVNLSKIRTWKRPIILAHVQRRGIIFWGR